MSFEDAIKSARAVAEAADGCDIPTSAKVEAIRETLGLDPTHAEDLLQSVSRGTELPCHVGKAIATILTKPLTEITGDDIDNLFIAATTMP